MTARRLSESTFTSKIWPVLHSWSADPEWCQVCVLLRLPAADSTQAPFRSDLARAAFHRVRLETTTAQSVQQGRRRMSEGGRGDGAPEYERLRRGGCTNGGRVCDAHDDVVRKSCMARYRTLVLYAPSCCMPQVRRAARLRLPARDCPTAPAQDCPTAPSRTRQPARTAHLCSAPTSSHHPPILSFYFPSLSARARPARPARRRRGAASK